MEEKTNNSPGADIIRENNFSKMCFQHFEDARGCCIAIIGGGGKTSLLHRLGDELAFFYNKVLISSVTRSAKHGDQKVYFRDDLDKYDQELLFKDNNPLCLMNGKYGPNKFSGFEVDYLKELWQKSDLCIFECDGARNLPLKVHDDKDPIVPDYSSHVIIVVGADVVNTSVRDGMVHRPDMFCEKWNICDSENLSVEKISEIVTSEKGYLSRIKHKTELCYFVNKADYFPAEAKELAIAISAKTKAKVYYGSLKEEATLETV